MGHPVSTGKRIRLKSLSDLQREQARIYQLAYGDDRVMPINKYQALSQGLKRLHDAMLQEREIDISEEMLALEKQLAELAR